MKFRIKDYEDLKSKIRKLSVRELLMIVSSPQARATDMEFPKGFRSLFLHETTFEQAQKFRDYYFEGEESSPVFVSDIEFGAGMMLKGCTAFPSMMSYGMTGDPELAYKAGRIAAAESAKAGYRWSYSPCVDICINHDSPTASVRCAGEDADTVITYAGEMMRGMHDGGLASTLKHFPGDGVTTHDHHISTTENLLSREEWDASYGKVYSAMIEKGAMSIMLGHISLPCYDDEDEKMGMYPPATLSKNLITGLLKEKLGFEGLVVSDSVNMGGVIGYMNAYKACATFLNAGGDILCFGGSDDHWLGKMEELVSTGYLPIDVLRNRAYRVECFFRQIEEMKPVDDIIFNAKEVEREIVKRSMRIVQDREHILPFSVEGKKKEELRILVLDLSNIYNGLTLSHDFYESLKAEGFMNVDFLSAPGSRKIAEICENHEYDIVLCSVANGYAYGTDVLRIHGEVSRNFLDGWSKLGTPVVFIALVHPYLHEQLKAFADTVINCYGVSETTYKELALRIFG